ncbi:MAG: family 78 glycoside hydrolase catalytic domain, partial [Clostridia bacterium]|nr:family 78 glycoside hydrolase catalytic domain [Clostridia bacterium]
MKQGKFITARGLAGKRYEHPWHNMDRKFNSYDRDLLPGEGILNVKHSIVPNAMKELESVTVRATALGIFDMFVGGIRVCGRPGNPDGADELKPGWTDYRFRVFEFEYDITKLCSAGKRTLFVAEVSPGWWSGRISFGFYGFRAPAFCGEIEISYKDGTRDIIATDETWDAAVSGPVLTADIWDGEYYDATIPEPSTSPEAHKWDKAVLSDDFHGEIVPVEGPAIRSCPELMKSPLSAVVHRGTVCNGTEYGEIKVLSKKTGRGCEAGVLRAGEAMILDFGQNIVGRPMLFLNAPRGTKITVYVAEFLNDSGDPARGNDGPKNGMYIKNYRSAHARMVYVASGSEAVEFYYPTHSFYGFRYIEIRADGDITVHSVKGDIIRSANTETGDFTCDNPEVMRLFSNIVWGMRGNYLSAPTDCPQRDERLGWTGDTQIFCGAASYIADIDAFMNKWLTDAAHSQQGFEGAYCDVIPRVFDGHGGNAAWGDAGIIVPYRLWQMYGDTEIVRRHFASMEYYMEYLSRFGLEGPNIAYGDWLNYDVTDKRYIAVCYYAYDASLMIKFSRLLGKKDREEHYSSLLKDIIAHWSEKYIDSDGSKTYT